ncbi:MAG: hypothetical protein R6W89_00265, partial [Candidatus Hydrogenedentota bacterium]
TYYYQVVAVVFIAISQPEMSLWLEALADVNGIAISVCLGKQCSPEQLGRKPFTPVAALLMTKGDTRAVWDQSASC